MPLPERDTLLHELRMTQGILVWAKTFGLRTFDIISYIVDEDSNLCQRLAVIDRYKGI